MESEKALGGGVKKGHTASDVGSVSSMPMRMQVRICLVSVGGPRKGRM